jgi:hypothetical protein
MSNNPHKLVTTFIPEEDQLIPTIESLIKSYPILSNKIFVLTTEDQYLLSYNLDTSYCTFPRHTIAVNRKKENNVIYSVNALNALVKLQSGGLDKNYKVDWSTFRNCMLVTEEDDKDVLRILPTKLYKIIEY